MIEKMNIELRNNARNSKDRAIDRKRKVLEAKILSLKEEFDSVQDELNKSYMEDDLKKEIIEKNRNLLSQNRSNNSNRGKRK